MPLATGTRLGPYEIGSLIGAGGMGHVHRARDTRLDRTVAIKVLSENLSRDPLLRERFNREARAISSLSHPNICTLYDVGEEQGIDFLVMEYLEGPTVAERLAKGPLPIDEALEIAVQVAEALEDAHRAGVTHRDLKPGNVMLTKVGAKLLDFGLARTLAGASPRNASAQLTARPDLTSQDTILGTLPYMSPEQIEGMPTDARCDIWALGCLLYEMVTGRPAFAGGSQASLITSIMSRDPEPVGTFQPATPARLDRVIRNCLVKDPRRRWQSAFDVSLELRAIADGNAADTVPRPLPRWRSRIGAGVLAAAIVVGLPATWLGLRPAGVATPVETRFEVAPPPGNVFPQDVEAVNLAVAPDGQTLAFIAIGPDGVSRLWTRAIGELSPRALAGTEGARSIIWSPDGRSLAFFAPGKLQRLDLPNGSPVPICDTGKGIGFAGSWGESGEILYASVQGDAIYRVAASGGAPEKVYEPDAGREEFRTGWPQVLPGNRGFLYLARAIDHTSRLMWMQPGKAPRIVAPLASRFELIEPDLLVFVRDGALLAQRFDFNSGQLTGVPLSVAPRVDYFYSSGWAAFAVSRRGSVYYASGENVDRLVWLGRSGQAEGEVGSRGEYLTIALSPDGRNAIADRTQPSLGTYDLWLLDLERNVEKRLTSSPDADFGATWLPDGKAIVYSTLRGSTPNLVRRDLTTGEEHAVLPNAAFQQATDIAQSGRELVFTERGGSGQFRAAILQLDGDSEPRTLFMSDSRQDYLRFSPDGLFIAYISDESGQWEAYVARVANPSDRIRISQQGARFLRWRRDGAEILLVDRLGNMLAIPVRTDPALQIGTPVTLFTRSEGAYWDDFDVTADGQRFLIAERLQVGGSRPASVILNWAPAVR
jgi:serine/threonine protein kinase/Tol biopolymer transport system component